MDAWFSIQSYNTYGGHPTLSLIGDLMEHASEGFDCGLNAVEITAHFATRRPPRKTLEDSHARFHDELSKLPTVRWESKKERLKIHYHSRIGRVEDVFRQRETSAELLQKALAELIEVCASLKPKLAKKKGLNHVELMKLFDSLPELAPSGDQELIEFGERHRARKKEERSRLPWWEQEDVDWEDFHPDARHLLDDPFFWSAVNDYAPHGNDTGADILVDFMKWRRHHRQTDPAEFLRLLFQRWDMAGSIDAWGRKEIDEYGNEDITPLQVHDEAVIALAFALIKVDGCCDHSSCQQALEAIERQQSKKLLEHFGWRLPEERAAALAQLRSVLVKWDAPPNAADEAPPAKKAKRWWKLWA